MIGSEDLFIVIESQRGHHTATGNIFYWDPINGNDSDDGLTKDTAKLMWGGGINSLITAYNHDLVIIIPGESRGNTIITEQIVLDTEYTFIRGPGRDVLFKPINTTGETVSIEAEGCELSGVRIETAETGDGEALIITGDFSFIHDIWVESSQGDGIRIQNVSYAKLKDIMVRNCANHGIVFRGDTQICKYNTLSDAQILANGGDGVRFTGALCTCNSVWGGEDGIMITYNEGWGIQEVNEGNFNHVIGPTIHIGDNTLGNLNLIGANSVAENIAQWSTSVEMAFTRKILRNKKITDPNTGIMTVYDDDGITILLQANLWEDPNAAQPYRGQGSDRVDRLVAP